MRAPLLSTALAGLALAGCADEDPARPNVLIVSLDSTRADILGCYGRRSPHAPGEPTSPKLDRLAAGGARFDAAYTTSSWTLPAHVALMTGQPDLVHGVETQEMSLSPVWPTLAETLGAAGYRTAGFFSGPFLEPKYGFGRGFQRYEACYGAELAAAIAEARSLERQLELERDPAALAELRAELARANVRLEGLSHRDVSSREVTERALEELERSLAQELPWLLFVHYFDPHYDYVPPPPFDERFDPAYAGDERGMGFATSPSIARPAPTPESPAAVERVVGERDLEHLRALYDGELAWTDQQIGRLVEALEGAGALDDTLVVVLADHGDEFFEHGNIGHRKTLYEEVVRVPLILRFPPRVPAGAEVREVVSLVDLFATVCELAGVAGPALPFSRSLVPLFEGGALEGGASGRLVARRMVSMRGGGSGIYTIVEEFFRQGPIKLRRARRWIWPGGDVEPGMADELRAEALRQREREWKLEWIDLEAHPGEEDAAWSSRFDDPRARAALEGYRALYAQMLEQRARPARLEREDSIDQLLGPLGYAGAEAGAGEERFGGLFELVTLPPPAGAPR